jgi:hypothetical protein
MKRTIPILLALVGATTGSSAAVPAAAPADPEWKQAAPAALARNGHEECSAQALGEWLRITCTGRYDYVPGHVIVVAGASDDVGIELAQNWVRVTFPVHRGDRRVLLAGLAMVSATWLADDATPTIVID